MVSERNRIIELENFLNSCGIEVNIGKNKARGNKGFFKVKGANYRIDIARNQPQENVLKTLAHEFAHYVHYCYDKSLRDLDFIFDSQNEHILPELLNITVDSIPKNSVEPLFNLKETLKQDIFNLTAKLKEFGLIDGSNSCLELERKINRTNLKYLLKYDKVKVFECFTYKIYSVDELDERTDLELYLKLKWKQRILKRVNSKISRLNKYYNSPTELFARSFELYATDKNKLSKIAPNVYKSFEKVIKTNKITLLNGFIKNLNN